jgi:hypothetical protein
VGGCLEMSEERWVCGTLETRVLRERGSSGSRPGTCDALGTGSMSSCGEPKSNVGVWEFSLRLRRVSRSWLYSNASVWCSSTSREGKWKCALVLFL